MSAGLRYKFAGSTVSVLTGYLGGSPLIDISAITKANPAVVSATGHGLSDGDVVKITEVVGMTELNGKSFIVNVLSSSTFELLDTDSSGYTAYSSGGKINPGVFGNLCELTNYNRQGGSSPEIPATTVCSTAQEVEIGLPDFGTTQLSLNFAPGSTTQAALHDSYLDGSTVAVKVALPNSGGTLVQLGFVQQESETAGVGGLWTSQVTIRNTGNRADF